MNYVRTETIEVGATIDFGGGMIWGRMSR